MNIELTDRQVALIVQSLRVNEKRSKEGFVSWLAKNIDIVGTDEYVDKCKKASAVYNELADIRKMLGDDEVVNAAKVYHNHH